MTELVFKIFISAFLFSGCLNKDAKISGNMETLNKTYAKATLGGGCFWCVEAIFNQTKGIMKAESGYAGGTTINPSYEEVCTGKTGHAEVVQITYDEDMSRYAEILEIFFKTHDPTTLNRQGNDVGTQYRSVIFYHNQQQKEIAETIISELNKANIWNNPIITEIAPYTVFYRAENYHQNYYKLNPNQPYCAAVITPKVEKFRKVFKDKLKKSE